jgi:uncharacterized glyoxalase superfamily protein PhnB
MKLSYIVIYVQDFKKMLSFYRDAFGLGVRFVHESGAYCEFSTETTTLALTQVSLAETLVPNGFQQSSLNNKPFGVQLGIEPENVKAALKKAIDHGASKVTDAEIKPWGWESAMVRDPEGNLIELARKVQ